MYWKSKWLSDFFQCQKRRELKTQPSNLASHTFSQTRNLPAAKMQGSGDVCPVLGKRILGFGGRVTGSTPRNPCFVLDFQELWVLLNLPVHSRSVQLNAFAKDACKGDNGRQGIYEHEMANQGALLLFPAHSFSHFVTLKITTWPFHTQLGITHPTYYTQAL